MTINLLDGSILPNTSLIICTRNRHKLLLETLESVLSSNEVPTEIIIVDQSAAPLPEIGDLPLHPTCQIRYVHLESAGASRARNTGIHLAKNEMIAFLDDDMFVARDWLPILIQSLRKAGPHAVVTGRVLPAATESEKGYTPALVTSQIPGIFQGRIQQDVLASGHMAAYRMVLEEVGCFDERLGPGTAFPAAEDNDLGFRLLEAGFSIVYVPEAVVFHRAWRSQREYLPMRWNYGRGKGGFYAKHFRLRDRHILARMIRDIGRRFLSLPYHVLRQHHAAYGDAVYIGGLLSGFIQWFLTKSHHKSSETTYQ